MCKEYAERKIAIEPAVQGRILPPTQTTSHMFSTTSPPIRQNTANDKKFKQLKSIEKAKKGVYTEFFKGAQEWPLFVNETTHSLCFSLICVRHKLNPENSSGLNFRTYTPLRTMIINIAEKLLRLK